MSGEIPFAIDHRRLGRVVGRHTLAVLPYALVFALALGGIVFVGANLSNAMPSESRPYGWPGPSTFDGGVATVRPQLVLAASLPPLLMGLAAVRRMRPSEHSVYDVGLLLLSDLTLLFVSSWLATVLGRAGAAKTSNAAFWAFCVTHFLLAASFFAFAVLSGTILPRMPALLAGTIWAFYAVLFEDWVRWKVLRQAGYPGLQSGQLPGWFYVAQALSPLSIYRAMLILWHPQFRDYEERAVLGTAALPAWMTPRLFGSVLAFGWVIIPLCVAWLLWSIHATRGATTPQTERPPNEQALMSPDAAAAGTTIQVGRAPPS